ncbi:YafY family protein [Niallia sp. NCCP-28]|uniref:helix-turn-helix transcriptional regulator n=1 Tax=Niallia sp. NCCP-28 TaxID=2934712 RepID=UPI0020880C41|nr:YafY family protein [Niallia sp. NCCP-28]GKU83965.1 DeoR family transcriptional regulator [Niallia sp. NCCP-28]
MKIERLLAMIIKLLNKNRITAKELAEEFEVSVRTIQRDIDSINMAGIPIVSYKGSNGGYGILEEYKIRTGLFNEVEHDLLLTALNGVYKTYDDKQLKQIIEKLTSIKANDTIKQQSSVLLDFGGWGPTEKRTEKVNTIKKSIESNKAIIFQYIDINGSCTEREIEPITLILKVNKWYVYSFCKLRNEYRLFKLGRMRNIKLTNQDIEQREYAREYNFYQHNREMVSVSMKFTQHALNELEDYFEFDDLEFRDDGWIYLTETLPEDEWVYRIILGLGDQIEVLEPQHIRKIIKERAQKICDKY